ncbi:MAG: endonuclease [Thiohalocapsa sp.]|uniref:endonuclease III domain-containing protein n=1 Tax=Thiohalocapsa sp. TaxID=2497641 RepID=UPI0025D13D85|nr:endonuclease [Thiohalocapsa sp.]
MIADGGFNAVAAAVPASTPERLREIFGTLLAAHGHQDWWPADTPFEVMLGAVLTQNTAWTNVEKALARLTERIPLTPEALLGLAETELAELLRPVGYFNVKAARLRAFCAALLEAGGEAALAAEDTASLRRRLLAMHGIGPETADDILLYAFGRPVFVVDAYTRRLFVRLGVLEDGAGYEVIRGLFEQALGPDTALFNEYHALIVRHAKDICRARRPRCGDCVLRAQCPSAV